MIVATKKLTFQCPVTQKLAEHYVAAEPGDRPRERFETVHCTVCGHTHMVDWSNGKTIEQED